MLSKNFQFVHPAETIKWLFRLVKKYQEEIILFIGVVLVSLLSFAAGYIMAKQEEATPIKYEKIDQNIKHGETAKNSHCRSRSMRALFRAETFRERMLS